ncbi:hypothetical protein ScPMuIL_014610 [Solemya velum]
MGLCKCPKKKVTNLFCFEHRVNVCENCLVEGHKKCVVQSYLQWLQDSDFNPVCTLCQKPFGGDDESVRLVCYDVYHWSCLNQYAQHLPQNTAPAGYTCPSCQTGIFPANNLASPVAETLRQMLTKVNWARAGLGLPLIDEPNEPTPTKTVEVPPVQTEANAPLQQPPATKVSSSSHNVSHSTSQNHTRPSAQVPPYTSTPTVPHKPPQSVVNVDAGATIRGADKTHGLTDRKLFDSTKEDNLLNMTHDHDEDKYRRRPALDWLARWLSSRDGGKKKKREPSSMMKRFIVVLVIGLIGFITIVVILSKWGRRVTENDPFLDPMANPNIRINEKIHQVAD